MISKTKSIAEAGKASTLVQSLVVQEAFILQATTWSEGLVMYILP